jgi:ketosteroid isomerase-like protein
MNSRAFSLTAFGLAAALVSPAFPQTAATQTAPAQPTVAQPVIAQPAPALPAIDRQAALDGVVAAEKSFARLAAEKGMRDAFISFLADDSVVFDPDPMNGREVWRARQASPGLLEWYPVYSEVSLAGDLGFNTGPYTYRPKPGEKPVAFGQFATVWKRQADGSWKAALDLGTSTPEPASAVPPAISLTGPARVEEGGLPKADPESARAALLAADRALAGAVQEKGIAAAYEAVLADDARVLRVSRQPVLGKGAARAALAENGAPVTWEPQGGGVARSGDLGYTYGVVKKHAEGPESPWINTSNYLRVWRKGADGVWKLAFDEFSPRPQKPKS